jgi:hypothetical protein
MVCRKRRLCLLLYSTRRDAPFSGQASDPDTYSFCAERTFSPQAKESATDSAFGNEWPRAGAGFPATQKPRGLTDEPFLFDGGQAATPLQKSGRNGEPNSHGEQAAIASCRDHGGRAAAHEGVAAYGAGAAAGLAKFQHCGCVVITPSSPARTSSPGRPPGDWPPINGHPRHIVCLRPEHQGRGPRCQHQSRDRHERTGRA